MHDRRIIYAGAFLRSVGTSLTGVLLGIYLAKLDFDPTAIGIVVALGLAGGASAAVLVTLGGDRFGRRQALIGLSLLGASGTLVVAEASDIIVLALGAFFGMLNGMGRDRGAALVLDQAILPQTTSDQQRTLRFAWYSVLQDAGNAIGALLAAAPLLLRGWFGLEELASFRVIIAANALLLLISAALYLRLSKSSEALHQPPHVAPLAESSKGAIWKLSALFGIDAIAGGFLSTSLLSFFFFERFGVSEVMVGALFFAARIANAVSHLGAAWLARRIGLVNTMVFTHAASSLLLLTVAFVPTFPIAALLFLLREGLVEMDVPTRQSYVMAIVGPPERTFAAGVTNLVRLGGWAVAPAFAGWLMTGASLGAPLVVGAGMKIAYDVALYAAFKRHRPPEEA